MIATDRTRIAETVRLELARARHTHRDTSEALGLSHSTFHRAITGQRPWTGEELLTIARILGLPIADLLAAPRDRAPDG